MTADRTSHRSWIRRLLLAYRNQRKRTLRVESWIIVLASYPVIAFALFWPAAFRRTGTGYVLVAWTAFMIRTFLFHASLVYIVIALIAAWKKYRRLLVATVPLLGVTLLPAALQYLPRTQPAARGETVTVMSVNLLMVNRTTGPIIAEIQSAAPEILLLQEYTDHWHAAIQNAIGADYPYVSYVTSEDSFGAAIYSRRPFLEPVTQNVPLGSSLVPEMRAVVAIDDQPVAIYNIHTLPPRKLSYVVEWRSQIADLADVLRAERFPKLVGGDFNFTENSAPFDLLRSTGLVETHALAGRGRGATWPVSSFLRWVPGLRLDRIFLSPELTATESRTGEGQGSDHRPIIARIAFRDRDPSSDR